MIRQIFVLVVFAILISGCASKKNKNDEADAKSDSAISSEPMAFDPQGSDSAKIIGLSSIYFKFNVASLDKEAKDILVKNSEWIRNHPDTKIQIEGHCDARGSIEYNIALGERRAKAAYNYLVGQGISPSRLTTISYGKERPLTSEDSEQAQAKNRRDNFVPISSK